MGDDAGLGVLNMSYRVIFERATADYDVGREDEPLRLFEEGKEKQVIECAGTDGLRR